MIQIYSEHISNRLEYTCEVLFKHVLKCEYKIINDDDKLDLNLPILNYSRYKIKGSLQIIPANLLFEEDIREYDINIKDEYYFFCTSDDLHVKYDLLAASFFMLSRYEEYLPSNRDNHDRYKAENSLAYHNGFLKKAVVNRWAQEIKHIIQEKWINFSFPKFEYQYLNTIDIDYAYAYKSKGIKRLIGGGIKSIIKVDLEDLSRRIKYILKLDKDPFDVYEYLSSQTAKNSLNTIYFFQVGKNDTFDRNLSLKSKGFKKLIKNISGKHIVGIHPSYRSNLKFEELKGETDNLGDVTGSKVEDSRQHYLKLKLPETYRSLIKLKVKNDYTMGYASQIGFRAGICTPFPFFDLEKNELTDLMLHPFQIMDGTLNQYLKLSTQEALKEINDIYVEIKAVDGTFITLWHNESLSEMRQWKGWKSVYEKMVESVNK